MRPFVPLLALLAAAACSPQGEAPAATQAAQDSGRGMHPVSGLQTIPLTIAADGRTHRFTVELADTPEERAMGFQFRTELGRDEGMLFTYDGPMTGTCFHMNNVPIALDIVFIGRDGAIDAIHEREPYDASCRGEQDSWSVVELAGGRARELGIEVGDRVAW